MVEFNLEYDRDDHGRNLGKTESFLMSQMDSSGIVRSLRDIPPAHYCIKINSFSYIVKNEIDNYESAVFEVGGYKWKLSLYANGNKKRNVTEHISLYLAIADTEALPPGWEVNVSFKLFLFDHIRDRYLTIQGNILRTLIWT
ncbi:hypothetical protein RHMOL_Rhmol11G0227400 [Rhododendron molle]|uniref:Uncharacterized protein n=1 Tax=Rhododendron molle TaxID=49168 RepID=A0ACC0LVG8_RHOML|nr:hypothetical protein RHMOL_Rhmol11G0227400 [Rhododendron molle]